MRREQEDALALRVRNALHQTSGGAARGSIASLQLSGVLCACHFRSTEGTLGAFSTANPIPLCLPHARGCDLKETWDMSEVQNEIS
jgi:hypothetical protein